MTPILRYLHIVCTVLSVTTAVAVAADRSKSNSVIPAFYAELGGNGLGVFGAYLDFKFDHELFPTGLSVCPSIGFSPPNLAPGSVPVLMKLLYGDDGYFLECGIGVSMVYQYATTQPSYEYSNSKFIPTGVIGFRAQPPDAHVVFRIGYTPHYDPGHNKYLHGFGLSFGYAF